MPHASFDIPEMLFCISAAVVHHSIVITLLPAAGSIQSLFTSSVGLFAIEKGVNGTNLCLVMFIGFHRVTAVKFFNRCQCIL